jgi:hypothetical protein
VYAAEAVAIARQVASEDPGSRYSVLISCLYTLGSWYMNFDKPDRAIPVLEETVTLGTELISESTGLLSDSAESHYSPTAMSSAMLALAFSDTGDSTQAVSWARLAAVSFRNMVTECPDLGNGELIEALSDLE